MKTSWLATLVFLCAGFAPQSGAETHLVTFHSVGWVSLPATGEAGAGAPAAASDPDAARTEVQARIMDYLHTGPFRLSKPTLGTGDDVARDVNRAVRSLSASELTQLQDDVHTIDGAGDHGRELIDGELTQLFPVRGASPAWRTAQTVDTAAGYNVPAPFASGAPPR